MCIFFCFCKRQWFIYFEAKKECNGSRRNVNEVSVPGSCLVSFFMSLVPFLRLKAVEFAG